MDGAYPPVRRLFPESSDTTVVVETALLVDGVRRMALIGDRAPVRLTVTENEIVLDAGTGEDAQASDALAVEAVDGPGLSIGFNTGYLIDGLAATGAKYVRLAFTQPSKPVLLSGHDSGRRLRLARLHLPPHAHPGGRSRRRLSHDSLEPVRHPDAATEERHRAHRTGRSRQDGRQHADPAAGGGDRGHGLRPGPLDHGRRQSSADMVAALPAPRTVWVMVPSGDITRSTVSSSASCSSEGDLVIEGGNSRFTDDRVHAARAGRQGHRLPRLRASPAGSGASPRATA